MSSSQSCATKARIITKSPGRPNRANWQRQLAAAVNELPTLLERLGLDTGTTAARASTFPLRVTEHLLSLMTPGDPHDPILRQFLPTDAEHEAVPGFVTDPVGDSAAIRGNGILHKYHGRALLVLTGACAVHCRYCFRRHFSYQSESISRGAWRDTLAQLRAMPELDEIILSGGDPLSLGDERLATLWSDLQALPGLKRIRVHTRLPVAVPDRITASLVQLLADSTVTPCMVLHINHPRELAPELLDALVPLRQSGITLMNQAVLLKDVNDSLETQVMLQERCFEAGVQSYYLHQLDAVSGAAHFSVSDLQARALIGQLRIRLPGYLVPRLVREIPGEPSKTPL